MSDLEPLEAWCAGLLARLEPAQRRALSRELAGRLRASQSARIGAQLNPDGSAYEPRKTQARAKRGAVRRKMFSRLRTARWMKIEATPNSAAVTFAAGAQGIAKVHQHGLRDRVNRRRSKYGGTGPEVSYPERQLLGFTALDVDLVERLVLAHLAGGTA
jgi:phage virion morphogenesis protein